MCQIFRVKNIFSYDTLAMTNIVMIAIISQVAGIGSVYKEA